MESTIILEIGGTDPKVYVHEKSGDVFMLYSKASFESQGNSIYLSKEDIIKLYEAITKA